MARILVIDDEAAVRITIQIVLANAQHDVVLAEDGRAGLAAFKAGSFDMVVLDLFMPGMDGFECMRMLRQQAPHIPVLAMSGFMARTAGATPDYLLQAGKLGATATLAKPFKPDELVGAVAKCLGTG